MSSISTKTRMEELLEMTRAHELVYLLYEHFEAGTEINKQSFLNTLDTMKIYHKISFNISSHLTVNIYPSRYDMDRKYTVSIVDNKIIGITK
jgi:hypothetical protein